MFVGIGVGIGRNRFAQGIFNAYNARVVADGGITEAGNWVNAVTGLLLNASLLIIPSGYKGGKLYSEIPTNGNGDLTWTRGSDAFRTNASGLIQRVPWNLLQYSEAFDNALWIKTNTTVTANSATSPNGTLTADTVTMSGTTSQSRSFQQLTTVGNSLTNTFSIYIKYVDRQFIQLVWGTAFSTADYANFNIQDGTVTGGTYTNASIVNVGDSWYRISITSVGMNTTPYSYVWAIDSSTASRASASSGGGSYFIWGAQLVEGTTAQTYLPTTDRLNFPRLSYMYGSCPAVLLEPQRTNLATYSNDFTDATWVKSFTSITANTTTSPNGETNAHTFTADGTSASHTLQKALSLTSGTTYSISIFAKKGTNNFIQLTASAALFGTNFYANYDLNNGVLGTVGSSATATIVPLSNGWYRCTITGVAIATILSNIAATIISSSTSARLESNSLSTSVFIYGAQLEAGAYPTTYIPTTSATATRVADSFSRNNIYTNGLISASGGTWFVELRGNVAYVRDSSSNGFGIGDSSSLATNSIFLRLDQLTSARLAILKRIAGIPYGLYTTTTDTTKIAIKWNGTSADIFVNGVKEISATAFTTTNMDFLAVGSAFGVGVPIFIQQMALFNSPLTDAQCQTLTT